MHFFAGKRLVACRSAVDSFSSIVETVGGEQEKTRAEYVLTVTSNNCSVFSIDLFESMMSVF